MIKTRVLKAFSIFELLVVLTLIGVLAMVIHPNYSGSLAVNHRALAKAYLLEISLNQEDHLRRYHIYASDLEQLGMEPSKKLANYYTVILTDVKNYPQPLGYTATAVPKKQLGDPSSEPLSLDHLGRTSDNWNQ
jgi:Tfp pilus assembly protein PilE